MEHASRRLWTIAALDLLLLLILVLVEWNLVRTGTFGLTFDLTQGTVLQVEAGGPAALAGIHEGDRIDLPALRGAHPRRILLQPFVGESLHLVVDHDDGRRSILLTAVRAEDSLRTTLDAIGFPILVVVLAGLSSFLLIVRPQPATWAFYAYALLMAIKSFEGNLLVAPPVGMAVIQVLFELAWSAAVVALLFFATRIFASSRPWRTYVETAAVVIGLVDAYVWSYPTLALLFGWNGSDVWTVLQRLFDFAALSLILGTLLVIAISSRRERRQHTMWVLVGISLVPLLEWLDAVMYLGLYFNPSLHHAALATDAVDTALRPWLPIFASVAVYYALVHERVVDIRFAIGRAAEYALTTAVIVGFSFNAVHSRVDQFIEAVFFFKERDAQERLLRVSRALLYANSERLVIEFLLDHPLDALELTSGAIFTLNESRTAFKRIAAASWENAPLNEIAIDDAIVAQLRAVQAPLNLRSAGWHPGGLPAGDKAPTLAVRVLVRGDVFAIALYGRHINGAEISRDEQDLLHSVAANAAAAFDHLDAERTRREIEALRSENAALQKLSAR
jgi:hypothetical protein